jgi:molybdate transport system substrate-binding protein
VLDPLVRSWSHVALAALMALVTPARAAAGEITVLCARGVQHAVAAAAEDFQRATRHSVWLSYGTVEAIADRARTEEADVVIGRAHAVTELETKGAVQPGTRVLLGRVSLAVAVRVGAPGIDVSTAAKLRQVLLAAPTLGYADPARGDPAIRHFRQVLESLGVSALLAPRTTLFADAARALDALARGQVTLVIAPLNEILRVDGVTVAGLLPSDAQEAMVYAAGVLTRSATPAVAIAFIAHLKSPDVRAQLRGGGIEPAE